MKRIYFGNITVDTTDELANAVRELAEKALENYRHRSRPEGNGYSSMQAFAIGRTESVTVTGYVNEADTAVDITFVLTPGIHLAIAPISISKAAPVVDMTLPQVRAQIVEYGDS